MSRPRSALRAGCAVLLFGVLIAVGVAKVHGTPPSGPDGPAPTAAPAHTVAPAPLAPPDQPTAVFDGHDARVQQATADAAQAGAQMSILVLDRNTDQMVGNGNYMPLPMASVAKLFIADDLLLQQANGETQLSPADRSAFDIMLRSSDDSAAEVFWNRGGGSAIISRVIARYGLTATTAPYNGKWDVTLSTASDIVRYYDKLLDGSGGLPMTQANVILANLAQSTPTGVDGYPQRFGIPDGLSGAPVAVKQGWFCCWNGANQMHISTGVIGAERRYVLAIGALQPSSEGVARNTLTQAVRTMFPGGRV